jgi:putative FmdB family regulatory protein
MPIYEYECENCGHVFELRHGIKDAPASQCPECFGKVSQRITGGSGFIIKGSGGENGSCLFETSGKTCCGRNDRCEKPQCES